MEKLAIDLKFVKLGIPSHSFIFFYDKLVGLRSSSLHLEGFMWFVALEKLPNKCERLRLIPKFTYTSKIQNLCQAERGCT